MEPWERSERDGVKKPPPAAALGDILRRLPDMASLQSAALACKSWGRVASDPGVFHRFLSLRRAPLVGFILTDRGADPVPVHNPEVRFITASSRHPKQVCAASYGDFYFLHHPRIDRRNPRDEKEWRLRGCDGGLLLLSRGCYEDGLAVYDPLERTAVFFRKPHPWGSIRLAIVANEIDASFQVVAIRRVDEESAAVFSSRTHEWTRIDCGSVQYRFVWRFNDGIAAGQFVYWRTYPKQVPDPE
jgi:hypothetical protein